MTAEDTEASDGEYTTITSAQEVIVTYSTFHYLIFSTFLLSLLVLPDLSLLSRRFLVGSPGGCAATRTAVAEEKKDEIDRPALSDIAIMELLATIDGYHLTKIRRAAQVARIELKVTTGLSDEALAALHSQAKSLLLKTTSGYLTQHNAILRHIAEASEMPGLYGSTDFESAQVIL